MQHCRKTTNPVSDFWHNSSCSSKWGSNWPRVSSPTQHVTTLSVSCARVMIFTQDLSMLEKRLASWKRKSMHCLPSSLVDMCICKYYCERFVPRSPLISRWSMIVRVSAVLNSWFPTTWQAVMLLVNTRNIFIEEFTWKWFSFPRREKHFCSWYSTHLCRVKRSFKPYQRLWLYQRLEKRVEEKNGAQKAASARPANGSLVTFSS